jgi:hypothetical protein
LHASQTISPERAIGGLRPHHRHAVANLKVAHAIAALIDFPDDAIRRWPC